MNHHFKPSPLLLRLAFAAVAIYAALLIGDSVAVLYEHYSVVAQLTGTGPMVVA